MKSQHGKIRTNGDPIHQLEAEIRALREENQRLRLEKVAEQEKRDQLRIMEERYLESQSRFKAIFNQSKLGKKIINPDLKILQINPALLRLLGYSEPEMVGTRITTFAHPDFVHHWQQLQESLWTKEIPSFQIETCLVKKDGSVIWCQVTSILFRDQGNTLGYTIVEDINQRKKLELALQKLYDNQETIMHMIVHDMKNYLLNIKFLNEMLLEQLVSLPGAGQGDPQTLIQKSSDNCAKAFTLAEDILLIGRIDAPTDDSFEKIDLNTFIPEQLKSLGLDAKKKQIQIYFHSAAKPVYARIMASKFTHVLENLLGNAIKFTPPGGVVTISLKKVNKQVLLQVSDTGIGIPAHLQESIFEKFTTANRVGTEGESTTGLGLYIVKQIVEKHKGKIWLESQENVGTSFYVQLHQN